MTVNPPSLTGVGLFGCGAGAVFFGGGGCVSLPVPSASELVQIFRQGGRFDLNAFLMEFFDNLLGIEAAFFHPLQVTCPI